MLNIADLNVHEANIKNPRPFGRGETINMNPCLKRADAAGQGIA